HAPERAAPRLDQGFDALGRARPPDERDVTLAEAAPLCLLRVAHEDGRTPWRLDERGDERPLPCREPERVDPPGVRLVEGAIEREVLDEPLRLASRPPLGIDVAGVEQVRARHERVYGERARAAGKAMDVAREAPTRVKRGPEAAHRAAEEDGVEPEERVGHVDLVRAGEVRMRVRLGGKGAHAPGLRRLRAQGALVGAEDVYLS